MKEKKRWIYLLPVLFFAATSLGYFYSENKEASLFDLEVKASLFLFPILLFAGNDLYKKYFKLFLVAFILGNFIALTFDVWQAFNSSLKLVEGEWVFNSAIHPRYSEHSFFKLIGQRHSFFSYIPFSKFHHPSYFAMYLNVAIVMAYYLIRFTNGKWAKAAYYLLILVFVIAIILLSSRAGLLTLSAILIALFINEIFNARHQALVILISGGLIFGLFSVMKNSKLGTTAMEIMQLIADPESNYEDARLIIWESSLQALKGNMLFGVGNGDVKDALIEEYKHKNYKYGITKKLNVHNQYLETLLAGGIFALLLIIAMLFLPFWFVYKRKKFIYGYFLAAIAFNFMFESMLNVLAGVTFFTYFYCLLVKLDLPPLVLAKRKSGTKSRE